MNLDAEYSLYLYEELKSIHKSRKSEIFLVQNNMDEKFYIKRVLKEYTREVYEKLMYINSINMPKIYEVFEYEEKLIVIEEFINGYTLQEILEREGCLSEKTVIEYIIDLCNILVKVHSLNPFIIHRDIKPANIMISNDNVVKLIDFDISRVHKYGENMDTTLLGTKGYASPEQFGFDQTDCRSDIYAIGVMMNVLSTGKHIKERKNEGLLKEIIEKCTKIDAKDRYQSVVELRYDLEKIISKSKMLNNESTKDDSYKLNKTNLNKGKSKSRRIYKLVPGFRRGNKLYMILATLWYLFLTLGLVFASNPIEFIQNLIVVGMLLTMYLIYTNFLDIKSKLPMLRSEVKYLNICGYLIYTFVIFMVFGLLLQLFT